MKPLRSVATIGILLLLAASTAQAFCGFFVARAETRLVNHASRVVIVRLGNHTEVTMANDYEGAPSEFAMVIPVPTVIQKDQVTPVDSSVIGHLDEYTAPRMAEYTDPSPCMEIIADGMLHVRGGHSEINVLSSQSVGRSDVKIEARYTVGQYDILVLSARESGALEAWLTHNGYKIPEGAGPILRSYIKQKMKFFVARVNLAELKRGGATRLQPLRVSYDSPKFMLPIRLGTVNAKGAQELAIFFISPIGRVEAANYRTLKMPTDVDLPVIAKDNFTPIYRAAFERQVADQDSDAVFLEYAWEMGQCDPCSAPRINDREMAALGVSWWSREMPNYDKYVRSLGRENPYQPYRAFVTRLHLIYDARHFPEDLVFQETGNLDRFQCKYNIHHRWQGPQDCSGARKYRRELPWLLRQEARNLAQFTGWSEGQIRPDAMGEIPTKMGFRIAPGVLGR